MGKQFRFTKFIGRKVKKRGAGVGVMGDLGVMGVMGVVGVMGIMGDLGVMGHFDGEGAVEGGNFAVYV